MTFLTGELRDKTTHWAMNGVDGFGDPSYAAPVVFNARWERRENVVRDDDGEERRTRFVVHLSSDVAVNDFLFRGESTVADPLNEAKAMRVRDFMKIDFFDNLSVSRKALL